MRRMWTALFGAGMVALVAVQFIRPTIPHPPVTADLAAPPEVKQILRNSCYDCHSNETKLAWFDQIVPAYWLVASDVKEARSHINFSEIGKLPPGQQKAALYEGVNQVQFGAMPLRAYTRLHRETAVTPTQLSVLKSYLNPPYVPTAAAPSVLAADDEQYEQWIREGNSKRAIALAPNGIEFPSAYKDWKAVSTTNRFDNGTLRVILGNDTAIKAIAENHINPWPNGTTFAKVAWFARDDGQGGVRTGAFFQVEFMIRDSRKYAATDGWGWARWRGAGLTPYGKDAGFPAECTGCHAPMRDNDYVFTIPVRAAAVREDLPRNPLQWKVITSLVDKQASTMSTLYGNDAAVRYARCNSQQNYPAGSVLSLVTWAQRDDEHWFGAKIPGQVKSVELLTVDAGPNGVRSYSYESYQGSPLEKAVSSVGPSHGSRAAYLLSLRAAVTP